MAVQQINLSNVGYLDQAGALGHQGAFDEIVFYDDAAQTRRYFTTNGDGTPAGLAQLNWIVGSRGAKQDSIRTRR